MAVGFGCAWAPRTWAWRRPASTSRIPAITTSLSIPPFDEEIPSNRNHLHFGGGQTEARIELPPGRHTIQLLMGDHEHVPHDPPLYSERITVIVPAQTSKSSKKRR